jgi:hypothetical protein
VKELARRGLVERDHPRSTKIWILKQGALLTYDPLMECAVGMVCSAAA